MFAVPLAFMTYKTSPRRKALAGFAQVESMGCLGKRGNPLARASGAATGPASKAECRRCIIAR